MSNKIFYTILAMLAILNFFVLEQKLTFKDSANLEITILDVGQGDSILIKTPNNSYGLIDTGKGTKIMEELGNSLPFFTKTFEFLILTHPDADHIEGFLYLFDRFEFKNIFFNKINKDSDLYFKVIEKLRFSDSKVYSLTDLNDFKLNSIDFDILWPTSLNLTEFEYDPNESSISLKINYKNFSFYSAGDLGDDNELLTLINLKDKQSDILKVSHHGSQTSTSLDFLDELKPKVSVISLGKDNPYNHPHSTTIQELESVVTNIFRTDINGRVKIETDGDQIYITPHFGEGLIVTAK